MDTEKVLKKDGKARKTTSVKEYREYLDGSYSFESEMPNEISETGLLKIFCIKSDSPKNPYFIGRWDEKKNVLDVDIYGVSIIQKIMFKKGKKGYSGHHTSLANKENREFNVCINMPEKKVYEGLISFNLFRDLELMESIKITDTLKISKIKGLLKLFFLL